MRRRLPNLAGIASVALAAFALTAVPHTAGAWCRTRTDSTKAKARGDSPTDEEFQCYGTGNQLYWRSRCISFEIYPRSKNVSGDQAHAAVAAAFAKWTQTSCPLSDEAAGKNPNSRIAIDVRDLGDTDCTRAGNPPDAGDRSKSGYDPTGPNQNVIIFRDDYWPYDSASATANDQSLTLGLTTVSFSDDGEIHDADMELNTIGSPVKLTDIGPEDYDLASIVTHEAGHFLGMAHSNDATSTMYFEYQPGETRKQFLKLDDINGICNAYAPGDQRTSDTQTVSVTACDPTPQGGILRSCPDDSGGCAVSERGEEPASFGTTTALVAITGAVLVFARAHRKKYRG